MKTMSTKQDANLGQLFAIALGIFGCALLFMIAPPVPFYSHQIWTGFWSVLAVFGGLFLGNAANQRLNVLLFERELPVGIFTLVAFPILLLLVAAR